MISIIGAGALGKIVYNIFVSTHKDVNAFYDSNTDKIGNYIYDIPIKNINNISSKNKIIVAIGKRRIRLKYWKEFYNYNFCNAIHSSVIFPNDINLGNNIIIKSGAVIEHGVTIGNNCIIGNNSTICHDTKIGNNCRISPGVTIAGHVNIASNCYLCPNVSIDRKIIIESNSIIASGCTIWKNVAKNSLVKLPNKMEVRNCG